MERAVSPEGADSSASWWSFEQLVQVGTLGDVPDRTERIGLECGKVRRPEQRGAALAFGSGLQVTRTLGGVRDPQDAEAAHGEAARVLAAGPERHVGARLASVGGRLGAALHLDETRGAA